MIDGCTVGYLFETDAKHYRKRLAELGHPDVHCSCTAIIVADWQNVSEDRGHFAVQLNMLRNGDWRLIEHDHSFLVVDGITRACALAGIVLAFFIAAVAVIVVLVIVSR